MGDEADAMWDGEMIEQGREDSERDFSDRVRSLLRNNCNSHTFRKGAPKRRRKASTVTSAERE
jgi:hypothetical protein